MNSGRVIQSPLIQTIFRRLSSGDSRSLVNNANSPCVLTKINDIEKNVNSNTSPTHQRFFTTLNSQPIPLHRTMDSKPSTSSKMSGASSHKTNRLSLEKSPYLRQHMHNPVDWYPWSDEAFERARKENKLIFLSVGYSTCHWCHVMEKESFENDTVAEIMNKHFINVKVDREERPDIDKVYMTFIQATTFRGGWPMSVFLTPDLKPITGGTYFPPEDTRHQIGFKTLLLNIAKAWNENQESVIKAGESSTKLLEKSLESDLKSGTSQEIDVPSLESMHKCFQQYAHSYESEFGGFNDSPKFPQPSNFNFLFHVYVKDKESDMGRISYEMCIHTLRKMAKGGIYDHIGDGFARYSVDNKWHVPHFEKMLYDQGQLVISYCDAFLVTKDEFFANVVRGILKYVLRDLSHDLGGFYSAEDADSLPKHTSEHKMEGAFYVWEYNEIKNVLADRKFGDITYTELFAHHYNVTPGGNVDKMQDPHGELLNKNVLIVFGSIEKTASHYKINAADVRRILKESRDLLYEVRNQRPRPHLDSKIITAWNGLMISGCSKAGHVLKDQSYINRAILCANFIKKFLYNEGTKTLLRSCYRGSDGQIEQISVPISGFLDDYAFLIRGLLDLYEASLDADWLQWAETLQEQQDRLFWDSNSGGYFHSASDSRNVIMRLKEDQDGAEPSGNSVSVQNLLRIAAYLDRSDLKSKAGRILTAFSYRLCKIPMALPEMVSALISYHDAPTQVFIAGSKDDPQTTALLDVVRERLLPGRLLAVTDGPRGSSGMLYQRLELVSRLQPLGGRPTAYVCRHYACSLPVTEPNELADLLDNNDRND